VIINRKTIMDMIYSVDPETRSTGAFVCDCDTAMHLRKITDTDGRFAWQDAWHNGEEPRLFGYPVYADERFAGLARQPDPHAIARAALEAAAICALCQVSADPHRTAESVAMDINNAIRAIINDPARVAEIVEGWG
jgi:HK97 family phage major capsid protein